MTPARLIRSICGRDLATVVFAIFKSPSVPHAKSASAWFKAGSGSVATRVVVVAALASGAMAQPLQAQDKFGAFMTCLLGEVEPGTTGWLKPGEADLARHPKPLAGLFEVPLDDVLSGQPKTYAVSEAVFKLRDFGGAMQNDASHLRILPTENQVQVLFTSRDGDGENARTLWVLSTGPGVHSALIVDGNADSVAEDRRPLFSGYCRFQNSRKDFDASLAKLVGGER